MESGDEPARTNLFWLILPFIITSCFIIPMVMIGLSHGEEYSYWCVFLPGTALFIFPAAKMAALLIQTRFKAGTFHITKEMSDSNSEISELKDKVKKWFIITLLTEILVFLCMMVGVRILNTVKHQGKPRQNISGQPALNGTPHARDYRGSSVKMDGRNIPPAFIESSIVHKRLQFYDNLIYKLILVPFLGILGGTIYLIRSLIGRWWKKGKKTPLVWKIVPFLAIACFLLPIILTDAIAEKMNTTIRTEALKFLNAVSDNVSVIINGKAVDNQRQVISELTASGLSTGHCPKSPKDERIVIQVIENDYSLTLELGRDAWLHTGYWVFYPGYRHPRLNEIGQINTDLLDGY